MTTIRAIRADTYDGGRWLRLAKVTSEPCEWTPNGEWVCTTPPMGDRCSGCNHDGTRTVSPVLPGNLDELLIATQCPECEGRGTSP